MYCLRTEYFVGGGGSGEPIARTSTYLGTMLDEKLKFNAQIEYVKSRLSQFCGMTYRLKRYFTLDVSRKFYYSCVYPVITYYVTVWGGALRCTAKGAAMQKLSNSNSNKSIFTAYERCW